MICKNCNQEIQPVGISGNFIHRQSGLWECRMTFAEPIMGHINRYLDAATILAEMEARRPTLAPVKVRQPNMDLVEGTFEGEL